MARYVLANRRAGKFTEEDKRASRDKVGRMLGPVHEIARIAHDHAPEDPGARRLVVFEADPEDVQRRLPRRHRDVLLEPEILHGYDSTPPTPLAHSRPARSRPTTRARRQMRVQVRGQGRPVRGAQVVLILRGPDGNIEQRAETGASGNATLRFSRSLTPFGLAVVPVADFWPMVVRGPSESTVRVDVPPLPTKGPTSWWHQALGVPRNRVTRGRRIRVGVADTGVGPHPCLAHVDDIGSFAGGKGDPKDGTDSASHGTHVCGIIAARPQKPGQYAGIAPGVTLLSARVFSQEGSSNQAEVAHGIEALSKDHRADLINLSLGATTPSTILHDVIVDALERGTLCVCAAANSETPGPVEWPGAFPETVAVSALGLLGWGPPGSMADFRVPQAEDKHGDDGYFLASNSCFGKEVGCAGPGVGIISTVPERFGLKAPFGSMTGTSMASPAACGALAALLAESDAYEALPRNRSRAEKAREILEQACRDVGLARQFEGAGLPEVV